MCEKSCSWDDQSKTYCSGTVSRLWNIWLCDFLKDGLRYLMNQYAKQTLIKVQSRV